MSCAVFHPKEEVIISNSEDKTTKVWDLNRKTVVDSFTNKEQDRFWIVAVHPDNYYFACGSDSALFVFSLMRDRVPLITVTNKYICFA